MTPPLTKAHSPARRESLLQFPLYQRWTVVESRTDKQQSETVSYCCNNSMKTRSAKIAWKSSRRCDGMSRLYVEDEHFQDFDMRVGQGGIRLIFVLSSIQKSLMQWIRSIPFTDRPLYRMTQMSTDSNTWKSRNHEYFLCLNEEANGL